MDVQTSQIFSSAPYCHVCQHYHEQGTKCSICGHSGKANIYKKMRDRSNLCRAYEIEHLNRYACPEDIAGLKIICDEIRRRIFVEEMGIPVEVEFDDSFGHFNYSIGKVGNAAVVLVKWKVVDDNGSTVLIIDNCGVLPNYRCRGLARRTVNEIIQLCTAVTDLHSIVVYLPAIPWMKSKIDALALPCKVEAYLDANGKPYSSWKKFISIWNPQQMGIATMKS